MHRQANRLQRTFIINTSRKKKPPNIILFAFERVKNICLFFVGNNF